TFNVIFPKQHNRHERLLLITALPDVVTGELWEEIDEDKIIGNTINPSELLSGESSIIGFRTDVPKLKTLNKPKLVKKDSGRWWVAKNTLTEPFEIIQKELPYFPSLYGHLVLEQPIVTIKEFVKNYPPEDFKGVLGIPL